MWFQRRIEVVDVGPVMFVVVKPHSLFVDMRFQRLVIVRERGKGEGHD
jgi:hypothetical protein